MLDSLLVYLLFSILFFLALVIPAIIITNYKRKKIQKKIFSLCDHEKGHIKDHISFMKKKESYFTTIINEGVLSLRPYIDSYFEDEFKKGRIPDEIHQKYLRSNRELKYLVKIAYVLVITISTMITIMILVSKNN